MIRIIDEDQRCGFVAAEYTSHNEDTIRISPVEEKFTQEARTPFDSDSTQPESSGTSGKLLKGSGDLLRSDFVGQPAISLSQAMSESTSADTLHHGDNTTKHTERTIAGMEKALAPHVWNGHGNKSMQQSQPSLVPIQRVPRSKHTGWNLDLRLCRRCRQRIALINESKSCGDLIQQDPKPYNLA